MPAKFIHNFVTTPDGGKLSYYTIGTGPGLMVAHGAMSYALTHRELALALSPYFTVHITSRRGRGLSSGYPESVTSIPALEADEKPSKSEPVVVGGREIPRVYSPAYTSALLAAEVSDLNVLLEAAKPQYLICISSSALITIQALLTTATGPVSALKRLIIFEPPLMFADRPSSFDLGSLQRFERERNGGDEVGAMVTAMRMAQLGPGWIPRGIMKWLSAMMFDAQDKDVERKKVAGGEDAGVCTMRGLGAMLRSDFAVAEAMVGESARLQGLRSLGDKVVLLSGSKAPSVYLLQTMGGLAECIPGAKKIVVPGVGHEAFCGSDMRGSPEKMVPFVRECFQ